MNKKVVLKQKRVHKKKKTKTKTTNLGSLATNVKRHVLLFVLVGGGGVFAFVANDVVDAVVTV